MDVVEELFETTDLYSILGISKEEVEDDKILRKAYMKAALRYHPDKAPEDEREEYTKKFQIIQKIYELFKDDDLRKIYDDTGSWPDDEEIDFNVESFGRLDENAVLEFKKIYQGSEEEQEDIKKYYLEGKGDIFYICDNVFFLNVLNDEEKVNSIVEDLIKDGKVERQTEGIKSEKERQKKLNKAKKEAKEAEAIMKERNVGSSLDDLAKAIARNNQARGGFLDNLAAKYGGAETDNSKKKSGKKKSDEADEGPKAKKSKSTSSANGKEKAKSTSSRATRSSSSKK